MSLAQGPSELTGIKQESQTPKMAVGTPAIWSSVKHVFGAMSVGNGLKALLNLNQKGGIDCPSCAWPDPDKHRSPIGEFCENGAKAIAEEATNLKVGPAFFQNYTVNQMAAKSDFWIGKQGRLTHPMYIGEGSQHYEAISWEEAFKLIAKELNTLNSPDEAVFYTSGRSSNEAAYLYQLFVRALGTNNLPDCSNMCHESSGVALTETLGLGKGSVTLDDFNQAEVIIIMGQNPGTNHPRMLTALEKAKQNGAKIVSINPLIETGLLGYKNPQTIQGMLGGGTTLTDIYIQIKINEDLALLQALSKTLIEKHSVVNQVLDTDFIEKNTEQFELYKSHLEKLDTKELLADSGVPQEQFTALSQLLTEKSKIIVCWAMGLTQHENSVATIQEVVNLLLLKGSIGKPGTGTCPVRGHSNVQGDRTVGILHKPSEALNVALEKKYNFTPPQKHGFDVVEAIEAMYNEKASVFVALGGNFLSAAPDTEYTAEALKKCSLTVQISTKLNRSHLIHGKKALILPCLGRTDRDLQNEVSQYVTTENSMGVVQKSEGVLTPPSEHIMSEPAIIANLGHYTFGNRFEIPWLTYATNYGKIRADISETISGFKDYEQKLKQDGGFYLPNGPREGVFTTDTGKAKFTVNNYARKDLKPGEFLMMTIRSHDQFNTTIYGLDDRYRGIFNERRIVMMNPEDMLQKGFSNYQKVNIFNRFGGVERKAEGFIVVPYNIPKGCVATYFPEANVLVPLKQIAIGSQTPASKSVVVSIIKQ
ncbi:FdhF/YdeP family oxidoreductase [Lacihabitans lacunae]|uniref:FdhF/YdeP family oxidoreductase n=1 Tax=Lacihabitans lacunae TaxID=1028214 RepID=A0ABV7YWE3_9BACT